MEVVVIPAIGIVVGAAAAVAARVTGLVKSEPDRCWRGSGCLLKKADSGACASCPVFLTGHRFRMAKDVTDAARPRRRQDRMTSEPALEALG